MTAPLATVEAFLRAVESQAPVEVVASLLSDDCVRLELPSLLAPRGRSQRKPELLAAYQGTPAILASQRYDVRSAIADGARVALEAEWTGALARPIGALPAGALMRAHLAMFFDVRDGRITSIRNYDCYEPLDAG